MEKRALLALVISFIIFVGFGYVQQKFLPPPAPVAKPEEPQAAAGDRQPPVPVTAPTPQRLGGSSQPGLSQPKISSLIPLCIGRSSRSRGPGSKASG